MRCVSIAFAIALATAALFPAGFAYAQGQQQSHRLTVDSPLGELLDNPSARAILERELPGVPGSMPEAARTVSLRVIAGYMRNVITDAKLRSISAALAQSREAVAPGAPQASLQIQDQGAALHLQSIRLWTARAPGATGNRPEDIPTLTSIRVDGARANGTAVIVAPGGGYMQLSTGLEGRQVADWFAAHGVTAFVLTYRLASNGYHHPTQLLDAQRAIRWVRAHASDYAVDPQRIGMIGFSAGGHLTAMTSTLFDAGDSSAPDPVDRVSSRPDFSILAYASTGLDEPGWTASAIASASLTEQQRRQLSPQQNVTAQTPPTFIYHTTTDELVLAPNAIVYYRALYAAHVPVELHVFAEGHHGSGLGMDDPALSAWPSLLQTWMEGRHLMGPTAAAVH